MNRSTVLTVTLAGLFVAVGVLADPITESGQAVRQGVNASADAAGSAAHAIAATGQLTSATLAVPLASGGVTSAAAGVARSAAANASARAAHGPLQITDETITAMPPPDEALKRKAGEHK